MSQVVELVKIDPLNVQVVMMDFIYLNKNVSNVLKLVSNVNLMMNVMIVQIAII